MTVTAQRSRRMITNIHREVAYPHPRAKVWRALTDSALLARWLMKPEGFAPVVGTRFRLVAEGSHRGWRGWVACEVLAVEEGRLLSYSWSGDDRHPPLTCTFRLRDGADGGTLLVLDHAGFAGLGGLLLAKFMMGPGWTKLLARRLRAALDGAA